MATYRVPSKSDGGGDTFILDNIELLSNIDFEKIFEEIGDSSKIDVVTYSLYNDDFIKKLFNGKSNVRVLLSNQNRMGTYFKEVIEPICPNSEVLFIEDSHAKIVLAAPNFVYLGSQNIEKSDWFQTGVIIRDSLIYDYYLDIVNKLSDEQYAYNYKGKSSSFVKPNNQNNDYIPYTSTLPSYTLNGVEVKFSKMLNWNQKFNGLRNRNIIVSTYTLPNLDYLKTIIAKLFAQGNSLTIYANDFVLPTLQLLQQEFPQLVYDTRPNLHAKMVLIENNIVWLSSQNFGSSGWFENTINLKGLEPYDYFYNRLLEFLAD